MDLHSRSLVIVCRSHSAQMMSELGQDLAAQMKDATEHEREMVDRHQEQADLGTMPGCCLSLANIRCPNYGTPPEPERQMIDQHLEQADLGRVPR